MLTGGDPLLMKTKDLLAVASRLRELGVRKIFLYTTWWNKNADAVLPLIDGIHFSLHPDAGKREMRFLHRVEKTAIMHPDKSFRLFVDAALESPKISVSAWTRVERKKFLTEQELRDLQPNGVPDGESLYVYLPTAKDTDPPIRKL